MFLTEPPKLTLLKPKYVGTVLGIKFFEDSRLPPDTAVMRGPRDVVLIECFANDVSVKS